MSVARLHWKPGPNTLGCVCHQRGVYKRPATDSLVVDVFVMPRIVRKRAIAVTVRRYRNYKPVAKREWQLRNLKNVGEVGTEVATLFEQVGATGTLAAALGKDVEGLLTREAETLRQVLNSLKSPAA